MRDGWITAGFNALNQPMYIWSANVGWTYFGYDPLGRCVKRWNDTGATSYLYYDGWNLIQEGSQSSNAERQYVHGARVDEVVAQITPPNNWIRYFHYDASGNCTLQTDGWGSIVEQYDYDAFGYRYFYDAWGNNLGYSPWGNRFLFTGREWLSDLKLYDYRNRLYQPELGRFLQPDPKEFAAGDYNLYRYCHNDPVNRSDPFGLEFTDRDVQLVNAIPGMFGRTEFTISVGVGVERSSDGSFALRVQQYDVAVTTKQVATTANGTTRTPAAIEASKTHENRHATNMQKVHDANQNKVIKTGLTEKQANSTREKEQTKLANEFKSAARQDQWNCKTGQGEWKPIIDQEKRKW